MGVNPELPDMVYVFPNLGSVYDRLSRMACETEEGPLNALLNDAMKELNRNQRVIKELAYQLAEANKNGS